MTSILFGFGMKFVFTNIETWGKFITIAIMHSIYSIFINGSFQSHQYGKKIMNSMKQCINNRIIDKCCCCCPKISITDFEDIDNVIKYNSDLAMGLSISFVVSASSSLIMMVYFAMLLGLNAKIENRVFQFMITSFVIDCIIIFGQILVFKKRDRKYFINDNVLKHFGSKCAKVVENAYRCQECVRGNCVSEEESIYELDHEYAWIDILYFSLLLAWFWIGGLTGAPVDISVTA